jgi:NADH-quinone oxidoreductase subunit J
VPQRIGSAVVGLGVTVLLATALLRAYGGRQVDVAPGRGDATSVGEVLFASWVLPFELLSLLLLAALVGALVVSRDDPDTRDRTAESR